MGGRPHPDGFCTCATHATEWDRPDHWSRDEVDLLEHRYGTWSDEAIARHLGRTVVGVRIKARRLGIAKRDAGMTSRSVALMFGVDETAVSKKWIRHGLLRSTRGYRQGPHPVHRISEADLWAFVRSHPEWTDHRRMEPSPWRSYLQLNGRWLMLGEVAALTGRNDQVLARECREGRWEHRRRGPHVVIHESLVPAIAASAAKGERRADPALREARLRRRRDVRKGIAEPLPTGRPRRAVVTPRPAARGPVG